MSFSSLHQYWNTTITNQNPCLPCSIALVDHPHHRFGLAHGLALPPHLDPLLIPARVRIWLTKRVEVPSSKLVYNVRLYSVGHAPPCPKNYQDNHTKNKMLLNQICWNFYSTVSLLCVKIGLEIFFCLYNFNFKKIQ